MNKDIRDVVAGDLITAALANQGNPILRSVSTITGGPGVGVAQTETGTTIHLTGSSRTLDTFIVQITNKGPSGEADFTDARYWGQITLLQPAKPNDAITFKAETLPRSAAYTGSGSRMAPPRLETMVCTNLSELDSGNGHSLKTDGSVHVRVFGVWDRSNPQQKHYIFDRGGSSIPSGTGQYKCLMLTDNLNPGTAGWDFPRLH